MLAALTLAVQVANVIRLTCVILGALDALLLVNLLVNINVTKRPLIPVTRIAMVAIALASTSIVISQFLALGDGLSVLQPLDLATMGLFGVYLYRVWKLPKEQWSPPGYDGRDRPWWPLSRR